MNNKTFISLTLLLCLIISNATNLKKASSALTPSSSHTSSKTATSMAPSSTPKIGFSAGTVLTDEETKDEDAIGAFVVPTTNAAGADFPDLSMKNTADESVIPNMTANINGQIVSNIIKNALMGAHHPTIWSPTHCVQVPFFNRTNGTQGSPTGCVTESGWYMDIPTQSCQQVSVTCSEMATLNFFYNETTCKTMCVSNGKPIEWIQTKKNLNPELTCIQQPIKEMGKSTTMEVVYSYDAVTMTCWKYKIPQDSKVSLNVYTGTTAGAVCEHMCHDIAPAGSNTGHSLKHAIAGLPSNATPVTTMDKMT